MNWDDYKRDKDFKKDESSGPSCGPVSFRWSAPRR